MQKCWTVILLGSWDYRYDFFFISPFFRCSESWFSCFKWEPWKNCGVVLILAGSYWLPWQVLPSCSVSRPRTYPKPSPPHPTLPLQPWSTMVHWLPSRSPSSHSESFTRSLFCYLLRTNSCASPSTPWWCNCIFFSASTKASWAHLSQSSALI